MKRWQIRKLNLSIAILPKLAQEFQIYEEPCILLAVTLEWNYFPSRQEKEKEFQHKWKLRKVKSSEVQEFDGSFFEPGKLAGLAARLR